VVERVIAGQSKRSLWWPRGLAISLLFVVILVVLGHRFYQTIQRPLWSTVAEAQAAAIDKLNVKDITSVERFIGDREYTIVFATSAAGDEVVVWIWDDGLHIEKASDGLTKQEIKQKAIAEQPGKRILRIVPGKLREEYVWEVFYTMPDNGSERHYYDYYRFSDGVKLDTYRLAKPALR
jgi:uncharacterized protein YpmB